MKLFKSILISGLAILSLSVTSCNDWLDVNTDPENPTLESAAYQLELAHCQFYTNDAAQFAAMRSNFGLGDWSRTTTGGAYFTLSYWYPQDVMVTTPYQWFFVGAGATLKDMYAKAIAAENWHYAGVAQVLLAYGFMLMTDLYGEMPYDDGLSANALPVYATGKTIYLGCFERIDEAIELLQRNIEPTLPPLSAGDTWNNGDVNKWLKLAYFLKARWANKLNKKQAGSYLEGKYDPATVLACLEKAMQSNADNTIVNHTDDNGATHDQLNWDEPVDYSPMFSVLGMNGGYIVTKMLYDNLTNFDGLGVEDPRADKIIPWAYSKQTDASPAEVKFVGNWRRSLGVDLQSNILNENGPIRAIWEEGKNWYIDSNNKNRLGDTVYVEATSYSKGYFSGDNIVYYRAGRSYPASAESGSFYSRVSAPSYVGTYPEACFIKAEVLFNQGDKSGAFTAYKNGIKAAIELMNEKLNVWVSEDQALAEIPSFTPIAQSDIDNFLNNGIGTSADLTLGRILTQKRLALHFSVELWNDMRRYDFNPEYFLGWNIPAHHAVNVSAQKAIPNGKQYRRWRQCSHEYNYNRTNLVNIGLEVPGADNSLPNWNRADDAWTIPVWWDSDQQ